MTEYVSSVHRFVTSVIDVEKQVLSFVLLYASISRHDDECYLPCPGIQQEFPPIVGE